MFSSGNFGGLVVNPGGFPGIGPIGTLDAASVSSGQAFLEGELEKLDPRLYEPLMSVTWPRDIVVRTGGGYVDYTSNFFVNYGTTGANQWGLIAGETNNLPTIQGNVSKDVYQVDTFGYMVKVPFLDAQRMTQVGRSLEDILQNGLRKNYDKTLDQLVYFGLPNIGTKGIINQTTGSGENQVNQSFAAATGQGGSRKWRDKTPVQILDDINSAINAAWARAQYDLDAMPNHILIPPDDYFYLNGTLISSAGNQSILSFLLMNNTAKSQGVNLTIVPCRQCIGAGEPAESGEEDSGRMVVYVNKDDFIHFDETVPLTRIMTQPSANDVAYLTVYIAKVGVVKFLYFQPVTYVDGIS